MPVQKTWTYIRPLFKKEFAAFSDDKLIVDGLANLAHRPGKNLRKFMGQLEKLFNVLHENYASYRVKPVRPVQLPAGNYSKDALTKFANDSIKWYNKFLLMQVFRAAPLESVCKLLSPKDQTRLTVEDAYQMFFSDHSVEMDKKEHRMNIVNEDKNDNIRQDQEVAVFRPQQRPPTMFPATRLGIKEQSTERENKHWQQGLFPERQISGPTFNRQLR